MDNELNEKLAKWAGFKKANAVDAFGYHYDMGQRVPDWICPDGQKSYRSPHRKGELPDFATDLNACFKWLVPKCSDCVLESWHENNSYQGTVWGNGSVSYNDKGHSATANAPALALCHAIEKLIDGEVK